MTLVYFAVAWTSGIALAGALAVPWQVLPPLGLASLLVLLLWRDERPVRIGAVCFLAAALGAGRFLLAAPRFDETSLATYNDVGWVILEGGIVAQPDERDGHANLRVRAQRLVLADGAEREVNGLAFVSADRYPRHELGDRVRVQGALRSPSTLDDSSFGDYLARQGVHSLIWRAQVERLAPRPARSVASYLSAFNRRAQGTIAAILPEPEAALLTGILLGVESGIPADLMADFAATGTTHIIAISGFNITILSGVFMALALRVFHRRWAIWVAMAAVAVYTLFVGASAAVVRAALMGVLYLLGRVVGRPSYAPVSLSAAAVAMTAWNPHTLWDVGFLLSFAATAGLMLYTRPLERALEAVLERLTSAERAQRMVTLLSEPLLATVAAQMLTTPVLLATFGQFSAVTLLSNILILPVQPHVMVAGGLAALVGLVLQPLGRLVGSVAWVFLTYTIAVVQWAADVPFASMPVTMGGWTVWAYYALLGGLTWWVAQPRETRQDLWGRVRRWLASGLRMKALVGASAVLLVLASSQQRILPDGRLHVFFLDVGQGDAIFIRTPSGRQALVDGGPSPSTLLSRLGPRMPFWDRSLDLVLLTHPDDDHITGLVPMLERYDVDQVIFREMGCDQPICAEWRRLVGEEGAAVTRGEAGLEIELDEGLRLEVLHPGPKLLPGEGFNDNSLVTRLTYGDVSLLLTGDIQARAEGRLLAHGMPLASTVLKVAHHGSCGATTDAFLRAVNPQVAVVSVGADNDFGHPCHAVLERLRGRPLYRTDEHGTVTLITDGTRLWVETERGAD
ncbi:MAG: DNA internalization-related competence protein ComEC/Rec2 [Chloroflexota bacterium]